MLTNYIPYITKCLESNQWNAQYAGIMTVGLLAEGSSKFYKGELEGIAQMILPFLEHNDPRVQHAAMTSVALLCNEFAPDLQMKFNKPILNAIIKMMSDDRYLKVQKIACQTIVNFGHCK